MKYILLVISCCYIVIGNSQSVTVKWIPNKELKQEIRPDFVICKDNDNIVVITYDPFLDKKGEQKLSICEYTNTLMRIRFADKVRITNVKGEQLALNDVVKFNNEIFFLASNYNSKTTSYHVYLVKIGDNLQQSDKAIELLNISDINLKWDPKLKFEFSPDSNKALIYLNAYKGKKNVENFNYFKVIGKKINTIWEGNIDIPELDRNKNFENVKLNNDGEVILNYSKETKFTIDNYVVLIQKKGSEKNIIQIDNNGKYIIKYKTFIHKNGDITFLGMYSNQRAIERYNGFCSFKFDKVSQSIIEPNYVEFNEKTINTFYKTKIVKDNIAMEKGISIAYDLIAIYPKSNGGIAALFEEYNDKQINNGNSSYNKVEKKDLITAHFDSTYRLINIKAIYRNLLAKSIYSYESESDQYKYTIPQNQFFYNDKIYNIFSDHKKNEKDGRYANKDKIKTCFNNGKANGVLSWIENGQLKRKKILDGDETKMLISPLNFHQISPNRILMYCRGNGSDLQKLGLLTFDAQNPIIKEIPLMKSLNDSEYPEEIIKEEPEALKQAINLDSLANENFKKNAIITYTVEVKESRIELSPSNELFQKFPTLKKTFDGKYYHYIVGNFDKEEVAKRFVDYIKDGGYHGIVIKLFDGQIKK